MTKSKDNKRRKAALLGMPVGTAERKLRKAIIHELASQCGRNVCRWCGLEISDPDELAVTHIEDWEESPALYFDLGNVALSHASCAAARGGRRQGKKSEMKVEVSVEDANGNRLPGARHEGDLYVAAERDQRYQVRVRNRTGRRVLVVVTVDGRNVNTGEPGDHGGPGHVLEPRQSWVFTGWRTSDDEVAAFRVGARDDAYSSQMGSGENVGVVGVAVFEERRPAPKIVTVKKEYVPVPYWPVPYWPAYPTWPPRPPWTIPSSPYDVTWCTLSGNTMDSGQVTNSVVTSSSTVSTHASSTLSSSGVRAEPASQELGTEFGEQLASSVVTASFVRDTDEPVEVHVIRYDSRESLRRRGIDVRPRSGRAPDPFPRNRGYCAPPPRRRAFDEG